MNQQKQNNMQKVRELLGHLAAKYYVSKTTIYQAYKTQTGRHIFDDAEDIEYITEQLGYMDIPEQLKKEKEFRRKHIPLYLNTETGELLHYHTLKPL